MVVVKLAWEQFEETNRIPADVVSIGPSRRSIRIGAETTQKHGLNRYKSLDLLVDENASLAGMRFREDKHGVFKFNQLGGTKSTRDIPCAKFIATIGLREGKYMWRKDTEGFFVFRYDIPWDGKRRRHDR